MKKFLPFLFLFWASLASAQPVVVPQNIGPPAVVVGIDSNGNFIGHVPTTADIASPNPITSSSSSFFFGGPQISFLMDGPSGFSTGSIIFIQLINAQENWGYCVITSLDFLGNTTCNITYLQGGMFVADGYIIQLVNGYNTNSVPAWAGQGVDGNTAITFPTIGQTVNFTFDLGKAFQYSSGVYCYAYNDPTGTWFAGFVTSYDGVTTGAAAIIVQYVSSTGTNQTGWTCSLTPLAQNNASLNNWASDNLTIPSTVPSDLTFTTVVASQYFPIQGQVLITCTTATTKQMTGQVKAYSGSTMVVTVTSVLAGGGTSCSAWAFYLTTGPTTRISLYQMNGLQVTQSGTTATINVPTGSVRDSTDTIDLTLSSSTTIDLSSTTKVVQAVQTGTISSAGANVTGVGTFFLTVFGAGANAGSLTDFSNQVTALIPGGAATTAESPIISTSAQSSSGLNTTTDTALTSTTNLGAGAGTTFYRGGPVNINNLNFSKRLFYGIMLAYKSSDGTVGAFAISFTPTGNPDLPSGYTYYRIVAVLSMYYNGTNYSIGDFYQPLGKFVVSSTAVGNLSTSDGISYLLYSFNGVLNATAAPLPGNFGGTGLSAYTGPKAVYSATITPTAVTGSVSSVNAGTEVITWSTTHNLTTGQSVRGIGTVPTGFTTSQMFYVNALSTTTFALYTTLADALADTNRVNLTTTTTGATMVVLVYSNVFNVGFSAVAPIAGAPGSTTMHWDFNLTNALASTTAFRLQCNAAGIDDTTPTRSNFWLFTAQNGTSVIYSAPSTTLITYSGNALSVSTNLNQGTWAQQTTNFWTMECTVWGALDERIPANDNDLILKAVA